MVFGGGVGIMLRIRNQDVNRIEKKIDQVIEHLNNSTNVQTQYLAEISASLKTMIEFLKNKN
jgi:ribulose 1,5-bisphosphate carboxylase large subunit-like protein